MLGGFNSKYQEHNITGNAFLKYYFKILKSIKIIVSDLKFLSKISSFLVILENPNVSSGQFISCRSKNAYCIFLIIYFMRIYFPIILQHLFLCHFHQCSKFGPLHTTNQEVEMLQLFASTMLFPI